MRILITLLCLMSTIAFAAKRIYRISQVYRPHPYVTPEKTTQFSLNNIYYNTSGTYDVEGEFTSFTDNQDYQRIDTDLMIRYGLSDRIELAAGFRYRQNKSVDSFGDSISVAGVESAVAEVKYRLPSWNKFIFSIGLSARALMSSPVETASFGTDIELGDEGNELRLFASSAYKLGKRWYLSAQGAFVKPGEDLADEMQFEGSLFYAHNQFAIGVGGTLVQSFGNDPFSDDPTLKPVKATGNTATINSVDRTFYNYYAGLNVLFTKNWQLESKVGVEAGGEFWDERTFFGVNLIYQTDGIDKADTVVNTFKEYDLEGTVVKVSPRGRFVKIDRGLSSDVQKGMRFDIYQFDYLGGNVLVAAGSVFEVALDSAIIKVLKIYRDDIKVEKGFVARSKR